MKYWPILGISIASFVFDILQLEVNSKGKLPNLKATAGVITRYQKKHSQDEGRQRKNALFILDNTCYQQLSNKDVGRLFIAVLVDYQINKA